MILRVYHIYSALDEKRTEDKSAALESDVFDFKA